MEHPEQYWINRGNNVIGADGPAQGDQTNQAPVYQSIVNKLLEVGATKVLDIGCNVGQVGRFLNRAGFDGQYFGVDSNPYAIEVLTADGFEGEVGNLRDLKYRKNSWDCVVMKDVIEHLESPFLLSSVIPLAKRYFIIASFIPWIDEPAEIVHHPDGYYMNQYNVEEVVAIAVDCSFELVSREEVKALNGDVNQVAVFARVKKA